MPYDIGIINGNGNESSNGYDINWLNVNIGSNTAEATAETTVAEANLAAQPGS